MTDDLSPTPAAGELADSQALSVALESDRFRKFLDHIPFAVAVAELHPQERIVYANPEFERLIGVPAADLEGKSWNALPEVTRAVNEGPVLSEAITTSSDYLGTFNVADKATGLADAWSNVIHDDNGAETFRLVALSKISSRPSVEQQEEFERQVRSYRSKHWVKPGITGLAQSEGFRGEIRTPEQLQERIRLDLYYIAHWSIWLDLQITLRTAWQVVRPPPSAY